MENTRSLFSRRFVGFLLPPLLAFSFLASSPLAAAGTGTGFQVRPAGAEVSGIRLGGAVIPYRNVTVAAQRGGRVTGLLAREGRFVEFEEPLATLDGDVLSEQIRAVEARIAAAQSQYRYEMTAPDSSGAAGPFGDMFSSMMGMPSPPSDLDTWWSRMNRINQAQAKVENLEAKKRELQARLAYGSITSPIDGVVTHRFIEAGEVVQPGQPLFEIAYVERLRAKFEIPVDMARGIRSGIPLTVIGPFGERMTGRVSEISPAVDARTHTQMIKLDLAQGTGLKLGDYVELALRGTGHVSGTGAVTIPRAALLPGSALPMVRVLDGRDDPAERIVRVAEYRDDGMVVITSGLTAGEWVEVRR